VFYRVAKSVVDLGKAKNGFTLKVSEHYLSELIYQLKQALLLIQFTEIEGMKSYKISTNIFYSYYYSLENKGQLPEGVDDFKSFMQTLFDMNEEDAMRSDFEVIAKGTIEDILTQNFNIQIEDSPFDEQIFETIQNLYGKVIHDYALEEKSYKTLYNDAKSCACLIKHDEPEPFFLTWDKTFSYVRKVYKEQYRKKSSSLFFHLFTPAKFVNHVDLVNFHIDSNKLSDDLISMIETHTYKTITNSAIDTINKFLNIPNITPERRKSYILKIKKEIYNDNVFPYETSDNEIENSSDRNSFSYISNELLNHFKESSTMKDYREMLLDDNYFESFIQLVSPFTSKDNSMSEMDGLIKEVVELVADFKKEYATQNGH
jgi:hypothetical protein